RQEQKRFKKTDYYPCEGILKRGKRVNDNGIVSGVDLVWRIVQIFRQYKIKSKVIAASLRNSRQVREVAGCGADILTIPFSVLQEMVKHDKTIEGMKRFTQDLVPEYEALMR
ncbi:MAG: transaldolase family protein, partial [Candidatus Nanoarchaeia archaeon]